MIKRILSTRVPLYVLCILCAPLLLACFVHFAAQIFYDSSSSGLQARNVQDAIDTIMTGSIVKVGDLSVDGNVGIGTTEPGTLLTLRKDNTISLETYYYSDISAIDF